jgi:hypothetical protein
MENLEQLEQIIYETAEEIAILKGGNYFDDMDEVEISSSFDPDTLTCRVEFENQDGDELGYMIYTYKGDEPGNVEFWIKSTNS